ncbi:MAG TPA: type II toxin-antitoxin system VapB family antitoxin [Stellaceae bacterium]|jgi:antitoxin VapB|nr:type II toxin-antitoxin system VapB family antitoxin [Stellaceae bacterium]
MNEPRQKVIRQSLRKRQKKQPETLAERLLAIGRDCAERLGPEYRAIDHDAILYDEDGLPRS